jgi:hypothetical protein
MLDTIKRWLGNAPSQIAGWSELSAWARAKQWTLRAVREPEGFVLEGRSGSTAWRVEWGPSQRSYIEGTELRIRAELSVPRELQALVLNRELMDAMEKAVFEQYVEGVQTRIDNQTPPEMRWLVMFPKIANAEMGPLQDRFVALGSVKTWLAHWLEGPLAQALAGLHMEARTPVVLMIGRGRLMLRTAMPDPPVALLQTWLRVFEVAIREAKRVASEHADSVSPSTHGSIWSASALPGDERDGTK